MITRLWTAAFVITAVLAMVSRSADRDGSTEESRPALYVDLFFGNTASFMTVRQGQSMPTAMGAEYQKGAVDGRCH